MGVLKILAGIVALSLFSVPSVAQEASVGPSTVNGCSGTCTVTPGSLIGTYTVSNLPACGSPSAAMGATAYVTDLGGGANMVKCIASSWQHLTLGTPGFVSQNSGTYSVTPLTTAPIMVLTGNITATLNVTISQANLYPGFVLYIVKPGLLTGNVGVNVSGIAGSLPVLGNSRSAFVWDGTALQQIQ